MTNPSLSLFRNNNKTCSEDDVLSSLQVRFDETKNLSDICLGIKNLIYFTLNFDIKYIDLFFHCVKSIVKSNDVLDFDLLVICPKAFETEILQRIESESIDLHGLNIHFFNVSEAASGIDASMNKLLIYQWDKINDYRRVLFLDVDILVVKSLYSIFNDTIDSNKLYSTIYMLSDHLHQTGFHRLVRYDMSKMQEFKDNSIYAFNAGQFMFVNSERMLKHLENVNWLTKEWPGEYFFEQSFLNHYFNYYLLSNSNYLFDKVSFISVHLWENALAKKSNSGDPTILHFAGHACNAEKKLEFINTFCKDLISY
jgi:lipopolysaccharide biosynthesis glycosyltransferase